MAAVFELLHFATGSDRLLTLAAALLALGGGAGQGAMLFAVKEIFEVAGAATLTGGSIDMNRVMDTFWLLIMIGGAHQKAKWKKELVKSILSQDVGWFDTSNPQELTTKMGESVETIFKGLDGPSYMLFFAIGLGMMGFIIGFIESWKISLIMFSVFPLIILSAGLMVRRLTTSAKRRLSAYSKSGGIAHECLFAMRTVASLGLESSTHTRYIESLEVAARSEIAQGPYTGFVLGLTLASFMLLQVTGFLYSGFEVAADVRASQFEYTPNSSRSYCATSNNSLTLITDTTCPEGLQPWLMTCALAEAFNNFYGNRGNLEQGFTPASVTGLDTAAEFQASMISLAPPSYLERSPTYFDCAFPATLAVLAVFAIVNGSQGIVQIGQPVLAITKAMAAAQSMLQILQRKSLINPFDESGDKLPAPRGDLELRDVVFAYPTAPEHPVCKGYSLSIESGKTCALCGPSGSGKSTIIALLERFYDPQEGEVLLDGVNIKTLNTRWLRQQLGLVGQEPVLFTGSVSDNIAHGKPGATQAEIEEAARMANAHTFITSNLSNGYDSEVGQGGSKLSGGQKQRIAIARALIKKPTALLLDEATSALDNESERIVQAALDEIMTQQRRTTVVIAHRLSTIRNADMIAVVRDGQVVEKGSYEELYNIPKGIFHKLAEEQQKMAKHDAELVREAQSEQQPAPTCATTKTSVTTTTKGSERHSGSSPTRVEGTVVKGFLTKYVKPRKVVNLKSGSATRTSNEGQVPERASKGDEEEAIGEVVEDVEAEAKEEKFTAAMARSRLWKYHKGSRFIMGLGTFFSAASATLPLLAFYFLALFFEVLYRPNPDDIENDTVVNSIWVLAVSTGVVLATTGDTTCFNTAAVRLTKMMRSRGLLSFLSQDMGFFDSESNSAGELTLFLAEKISNVQSLTSGSLSGGVRVVSCVITLLIICFALGPWQLSLALMGLYPLLGITIGIVVAAATGNSGHVKDKKRGEEKAANSVKKVAEKSTGGLVGEVVLAIRTVASLNIEQIFYEDYCKGVDRVLGEEIKQAFVNGIAVALGNMGMMSVMSFMFWYGQYLFSIGQTDFAGTQIPPMLMIGSMMVVITSAVQMLDVPSALTAAKRYFEVTDRVSLINPFNESGTTLPSPRGDIELRDVVFAYPTDVEHIVCKGYSLSIESGKTCALCGPSGSGKSTIIALLERFYDPQEGEVLLDGVNIKTLNIRWLRQQLGLVGQEPVLFTGSVSDNIAHGKPGATQAEIEEAARMANAHTFIVEQLPNKYDTLIGIRGSNLSGGQKQRIAIARALIKKPTALLLDEATSALDNESERIVQAALDEIMAQQRRTTVVIAHRLSTIRNADMIAVVHEGRVIETGSHDDLLSQGGMYSKLVLAS
ncbi:MAG: hypothetical protein SGPRY_004545 [Prymnesium sp.]